MSRTVPPLNPLHVFDAVARLGSLTKASAELCVTHSAVSRQLTTLEQYLGVTLFEREPRGVRLTKAGATYHKAVGPAFAAIAAATESIVGSAEGEALRLNVYTTFAAKWLMHRLQRFEQRYPNIPVEISTTVAPMNFNEVEADAAIQFGDGNWPGIRSEPLFNDVIEPVCSPALLRNGPPLKTISDLAKHRLLQSRYRRQDWFDWLRAVGRSDLEGLVKQQRGGFQNSLLAYQAAIEGLGVVVGQTRLLANDIASGALVCPFKRPVKRELGYYLLIAEGRRPSRKIAAFRSWLMDEISTMPEIEDMAE
ncbi:transcriptional regulator GcvA [Paraburkholderia antibiotica]|uniref:Transcriptional regulator GcvA n=1 Tax=Paraburkholderia antibiotica TaxID=2728839 RepID=A0A7X9X6D5_9BURK|nr:transcriptional regulator GcvA [Paraburkholderia antibiotica]NML31767.1 transcriptional regulator GcvA [Paraburkholderia antibiotica]